MKTKDELNELKKEYDELSAKLRQLSEEELKVVVGGRAFPMEPNRGFPCSICYKVFSTLELYQAHMKEVHDIG